METFITVLLLVFGVLQILLFFKIWGMTNDVRDIKRKYIKASSIEKQFEQSGFKFNIGDLMIIKANENQFRISNIVKKMVLFIIIQKKTIKNIREMKSNYLMITGKNKMKYISLFILVILCFSCSPSKKQVDQMKSEYYLALFELYTKHDIVPMFIKTECKDIKKLKANGGIYKNAKYRCSFFTTFKHKNNTIRLLTWSYFDKDLNLLKLSNDKFLIYELLTMIETKDDIDKEYMLHEFMNVWYIPTLKGGDE